MKKFVIKLLVSLIILQTLCCTYACGSFDTKTIYQLQTILNDAAHKGDTSVIHSLNDRVQGLPSDERCQSNLSSCEALCLAAKMGNVEMTRALLAFADINVKARYQALTALHWAVISGSADNVVNLRIFIKPSCQ